MNPEIMQMRGQLAVAREKYKSLELEGSGLIALIRQYLSPYEPEITSLEIPKAWQSMKRLKAIHEEMAGLKKTISKIESDLREAASDV